MHTAREPSHEMKAFFSRLLARPRVNQYGLFSRGVHNEGEIIACLRRNKNEHVWCLAEIVFTASTRFFSLSRLFKNCSHRCHVRFRRERGSAWLLNSAPSLESGINRLACFRVKPFFLSSPTGSGDGQCELRGRGAASA